MGNKLDQFQPGESATGKNQAIHHRAEAIAQEKANRSTENTVMTPEETQKTLYELRVHQIELQMQNEELRRVQLELETLEARYFDLYDMAPVGYFTVDDKSRILETNLTAAVMLGVTRVEMTRNPIYQYIFTADQDIYYTHYKQLIETGEPQKFELRLEKSDHSVFWALVEAVSVNDSQGPPVYRVVVSDISERKATDEIVNKARAEVSEALIQKKQIAYLQAQIKPHFLYNTLSAITAFCYTDGEKAGELLTKFSKYLRIVFSSDRQDEMVALERELELVQVYVDIEKARFGPRLGFEMVVDEALLDQKIMPLLLQPLVENAIKHGVLKKIQGGTVRLTIKRCEAFMEITIADDGMGMSPQRIDEIMNREETVLGVGVPNIIQRLYLHTGKKLEISSTEGIGTRIVLYLPFEVKDAGESRGQES